MWLKFTFSFNIKARKNIQGDHDLILQFLHFPSSTADWALQSINCSLNYWLFIWFSQACSLKKPVIDNPMIWLVTEEQFMPLEGMKDVNSQSLGWFETIILTDWLFASEVRSIQKIKWKDVTFPCVYINLCLIPWTEEVRFWSKGGKWRTLIAKDKL